jgi:hypothetical protein
MLPRAILFACSVSLAGLVAAATPSGTTTSEISHLLSYLGSSSCEFYRNGTWHTAMEAREHLDMKNNYLMNRSLIGSAEDFIDKAASASSISAEKYMVRCPPDEPIPSGEWLRSELARFRASRVTAP